MRILPRETLNGRELRRVDGQNEHRVPTGGRAEERLQEAAERDQRRQSGPAEQEGQGKERSDWPADAVVRGGESVVTSCITMSPGSVGKGEKRKGLCGAPRATILLDRRTRGYGERP